ncbi:ribosomal protein S18 acetylase RimI-like enzyme [Promicromonospora sp. AC04]|uniref:GNAT family N-acetyltransferase n=1 Tax=Promicromonospora sp. AC04 TaxID=2135723 RepID=UPI000D37B21F|nr:GNAT family N-acetyltransferase [Promicromonospora sp. AC04]PUB23520.1 ribosomal protein S18 acetylase RimI-like enzyme [Promicromonospora sp. AC04]
MHIRRALPDDARAVAPLLGELGYPTSAEQVAARFARLACSENDPAWVAVDPHDEEALLGFAAGHLFWPYELDAPLAELTALVVAEERRGTGSGRALVAAFEEWATAAGCCRATVASSFHRAGAHAFYERLGYGQRAKKFDKPL